MPGSRLSLDFYQRLGADLRSIGVTAIGDLHGEELDAFLDGGGLHTLKLSDEDLAEDASLPPNASLEQRIEAVEAFRRRGVERVVLSSSDSAPLASFGGTLFRADFPPIEVVDHRGAGDAMTAGLVAAALRGLDPTRTLQLACAAGAANVARRGLGNVEASLVESLSERVTVTALADGGES
jgi:1-phosphofructokinase